MNSSSVLKSLAKITSPVGLIAGNGSYPLEFAKNAREKNLEVIVVAHLGEADPKIKDLATHCQWIKVGELNKMIMFLKEHKVKQVAFAGGISRINLFGGVKLDLRAMALIARTRSVSDDKILRAIAEELEREGLEVISASVLFSDCVIGLGALTKRKLSADEEQDLKVGWEAAKGLGAMDIGQTVVVSKGMVVAVEAIEGTDQTIKRAGVLAGAGCVVVKLSKPQQDLRLDLPTIGPKTIQAMKEAQASVLVVEANKCIILEKEQLVKLANEAKISVIALDCPDRLSSLPEAAAG